MTIGFLQSTFVNSQDIMVNCSHMTKELIRTTPTLPLTGGTSELPSTTLSLRYVALGRGTQNYTCASSTSAPQLIGAKAILFDATGLAYLDEPLLDAIPPIAVYIPLLPSVLDLLRFGNINVLGNHFFDSSDTPTFDLFAVNKVLYGMKTADVRAPATANKGPAGTGAVDWLQLTAKAGYSSVGLSLAYRVVTAGGEPENCTVSGIMTVQYAAEYWFYD